MMNDYQQYIDSLILKELQNDDDNAVSQLFKFYYNRLFRAGLRWCANDAITEESILDVFLDMWVYRKSLKNITSLESYLKVSLRRRIFKKLKKEDPFLMKKDFDDSTSMMTTASYEEILIMQQSDESKKSALISALEILTPKQKEIIHLKYFEEKTYKEIVELTGLEIGATYKLLHDAIKKLKIFLGNK